MSTPSPDHQHTPATPADGGRGGVLVVGEALIDIVDRPGVPVVEHVGGSPANVALGLGRLTVPVRLHTALGHDPRGKRIAGHLTASGVVIDPASWSLPGTSTAVARIGETGAAVYDFDLDWELPTLPVLAGEEVVHVGSVAVFLEPGATTLERFLTGIGGAARVTFDPNIRPALVGDHEAAVARVERIARLADVVKLSDEDAAWLYPDHTIDEVLDRFLTLGADVVAVTLGGAGAILTTPTVRVRVPAPPVGVVDTVGAGDTFMAALIDALQATRTLDLSRDTLHDVGEWATRAAAITVQRHGANLPTRHNLTNNG